MAALVGIGVFMATLDSSIVNISLPAIARYFNVGLSGAVEWIIIAYLVVTAATLLTIGRLADMVGRKRIWQSGLLLFTLGSALCGAAPSLGLLIAARAFQGLGGALLMAISPAMLTSAFPPNERGRALGINSVIVALGVSAGPTLGGIITQSFTWRWIFFVNVPIGIIAIFAVQRFLHEQAERKREQFDLAGAVLLGMGLATLTLGLSFGQEWGWTSAGLLMAFAITLYSILMLLFVENNSASPLIDFALLRNRLFASANISLILCFLALFAVSFLMPFYLEELRGYSALQAGLFLTPLPLSIAVVAPVSGWLSDRVGTRWLASTGLLIACVGLVLISQIDAHSTPFAIIWRLVFTGIGQGMFQSPNNSALMGAAPRGRQGVAAGFLATGRVVGQSVSVALAGAIFVGAGSAVAGAQLAGARAQLSPAAIANLQQTFVNGFHLAFVVCASIAAFGVFTSLARGSEGQR
jgi:EmrB/QacA subfamily drug resistance transporter